MNSKLFFKFLAFFLLALNVHCTKKAEVPVTSEQPTNSASSTAALGINLKTAAKMKNLQTINMIDGNLLSFYGNDEAIISGKYGPGKIKLTFEVRSDLFKGEGGKLEIKFGENAIQAVQFDNKDWEKTSMIFDLKKQESSLSISFVNDYSDEKTKEDRNIFLRSINVIPAK